LAYDIILCVFVCVCVRAWVSGILCAFASLGWTFQQDNRFLWD